MEEQCKLPIHYLYDMIKPLFMFANLFQSMCMFMLLFVIVLIVINMLLVIDNVLHKLVKIFPKILVYLYTLLEFRLSL